MTASIPPGLRVRCKSTDDSPFEIDAEHAAFAERCTFPGGDEAEPRLLLLPAPVRGAVLRWAGLPEA